MSRTSPVIRLTPQLAVPPPLFTLLVVVSTSQPGGLRDDHIPGTDQAVRGGRHGQKVHSGFPPEAVRMPAVVRMPACHSRRFKGERPIGAATGEQSQPPRPCANPPPPFSPAPAGPSNGVGAEALFCLGPWDCGRACARRGGGGRTFSTAPTHQLLGSANAETTPARAPAAAADRTQRPDATCEGKNG